MVDGVPECAICFNFLVEPLTLNCEHSFCRVCVLSCVALAPDGEHCPLCRQPLNEPQNLKVNVQLLGFVKSIVDKDAYRLRLKVDNARIKFLTSGEENIPIMVLSRHLQLGEQLPLHISSSRYKILIRRVWSGNRLFLYSPLSPRSGTSALILRVDHALFTVDGKAHILVRCVKETVIGQVWIEGGTSGLKYTRINKQTLEIDEDAIPPAPPAPLVSDKCGCSVM